MKNTILIPVLLAVAAGAARAQSDDCATATSISGQGSWPFDTTGSTDSGLVASCNNTSADGWFAWTPTTSGDYHLSVCGASYDIIMTAYDACGGIELGCSDGYATGFGTCTGAWEDVAITLLGAVSGTTYLVQLDGWDSATGSGVLDVVSPPPTPPPHDDCANAISIAGTGIFPITNVLATDGPPLSTCNVAFGGTTNSDSWYEWTPTTSGEYDLSVCGAGWDIMMAVYDNCGGNELGCSAGYAVGVGSCIGGYDDVHVNIPSATVGTTYLIQFEGWAGQTGTGSLEIAPPAPTTLGTNYCVSTMNSTGSASTISATGFTSISANSLTLRAESLPSQPGIFIAGPSQAQIPFFNGFLCVSPQGLQRLVTISVPTGGVVTELVDFNTSAAGGLNVSAGASYNYQRWNRDPAGGGGNANFSDGLEIVHTP